MYAISSRIASTCICLLLFFICSKSELLDQFGYVWACSAMHSVHVSQHTMGVLSLKHVCAST